MDVKILKYLIGAEEFENGPAGRSDFEYEFPITQEIIIDRLSKSLTKLLTYKVSKEAYQRYSVRLEIINTLRDWSRLKADIENVSTFKDSEKSNNFLLCILKKYLTEDKLNSCDNVNDLIKVAKILLNSIEKNGSLTKHFIRVIDRIICLDQNEKSEKFLQSFISKSDDLKLQSSFIEKIYVSLKSLFIEKPLADCFIEYCSDQNKEPLLNKMDLIFEKIVDSPVLFKLVSNQLKELFVMTKYAKTAQNFIQLVLEKISTNCSRNNKDILDLYSTNLQSCVMLLRIERSYHTVYSKNHTVQSLKKIYLKDYNDALILISHFPEWLPEYLEFSEYIQEFTQSSDAQSNDES